jgi:hypothetical protein
MQKNAKLHFIKREVFYHKIQYSKVFKFDVAAAVLGIAISTVFSVLAVASIGTCSVDLSDVCLVFYYVFVVYLISKNISFLSVNILKNAYCVFCYVGLLTVR